jgi:RNA polymerase sigma-70 factor, ECF subfamily
MLVAQHSRDNATMSNLAAPIEDAHMIERLRRGDESAFVALIERYNGALQRLAMLYVPSHAVAEEVVQETWLGVLQGIARFEGRSSLKTWIFRIMINRARTRGEREGRSIPFSAMEPLEADGAEPAVDPDRFYPLGHEDAGWWSSHPRSWETIPETRLLARETRDLIEAAVADLPATQRAVITMRDIEGWESGDVCRMFGLTEANQRVLLHRARSKVRQALEQYLSDR